MGTRVVERYPDENKAATLTKALEDADRSWSSSCVTGAFYGEISEAIHQLVELAGSDPYLIRDWVWTAAQLRIAHPGNEPAARAAWSGLTVLLSIMSSANSGDAELLPSLRWLTDRVVEDLIGATGPHAVDQFVSPAELERIDDFLLELAEASEPGLQTLVNTAQRVAEDFSSIHHSAYFPSAAAKLRTLAHIACDETDAGYWARAALRYVHLEQDVVDDTYGYIGYLDDIQATENVHELVHGCLSWRPLVEDAIARWPMLARIHWLDRRTTNHLPPFVKLTAACALEAALDTTSERIVVTPEVGPLGFISASLCALADLKTESRSRLAESGAVVTFRQGQLTRFVVMEQPYDAGGGVQLPMVRVRNGTISIPAQHAALLEPATIDDPQQLATKRQIDEWMTAMDADQLTPVWRYRRAGLKPSVTYITDRGRFFDLMDTVRPFGRRLDELVPVAYHTRGDRTTIGTGAVTVAPAMVVCNDIATAEKSLRSAAADDCLPRYVIIDRSVDPDSLRSLAQRCQQLSPDIRVITFTTPDAARDIVSDSRDPSTWLIRPDEVDPMPTGSSLRATRTIGRGPLATFNRRQVKASTVTFKTVPVEFEELDHFADLSRRVAWQARSAQDRELETVAIASETALRQISSQPPLGEQLLDDSIRGTLRKVQELAAVHGLFVSEVAELGRAAAVLVAKLQDSHPKTVEVQALLERGPEARVLVGSRALAEEMNSSTWAEGRCRRFLSPHDLEELAGVSVLIVPSWFGTRDMRRLQFGGWAPRQVRVLFRYEIARLERLNGRLARELGNLAGRTRKSWRRFAKVNPNAGQPPPPSEQELRPPSQTQDVEERDDDADWLETVIRNRVTASGSATGPRSTVTARLAFFDDGRHFGIFAKDASLICLNEVLGGESDMSSIGESEAEKLLWKKVNSLTPGDVLAFPNDSGYSDVIDSVADALIGDRGETRRLAGLWRVAVREIVQRCNGDLEQAQRLLADVGVDRGVSTITSWLYSTRIVAPRRPAMTIPALLKCAAIERIRGQEKDILDAASAVYAARRRAGHVLVAQLSSASISATSGVAHVTIDGAQVRYRLLTIATIDGVSQFPADILGLHTTEDDLTRVAA